MSSAPRAAEGAAGRGPGGRRIFPESDSACGRGQNLCKNRDQDSDTRPGWAKIHFKLLIYCALKDLLQGGAIRLKPRIR